LGQLVNRLELEMTKPTRAVPESRLAAFHAARGADPGAWMGGWAMNRVGSTSGTEMSPSAHKVHPLSEAERERIESE
jgi:hypothetical protein